MCMCDKTNLDLALWARQRFHPAGEMGVAAADIRRAY
jgi:hypothetical protein